MWSGICNFPTHKWTSFGSPNSLNNSLVIGSFHSFRFHLFSLSISPPSNLRYQFCSHNLFNVIECVGNLEFWTELFSKWISEVTHMNIFRILWELRERPTTTMTMEKKSFDNIKKIKVLKKKIIRDINCSIKSGKCCVKLFMNTLKKDKKGFFFSTILFGFSFIHSLTSSFNSHLIWLSFFPSFCNTFLRLILYSK